MCVYFVRHGEYTYSRTEPLIKYLNSCNKRKIKVSSIPGEDVFFSFFFAQRKLLFVNKIWDFVSSAWRGECAPRRKKCSILFDRRN